MFAQEWPLIFFTLLGQFAAGTFIFMMIARYQLKTRGMTDLKWVSKGLLTLMGVMAVAIALSMFHLGSLGNAIYTVMNLGSSWLSREILFAGLFLGLLFLTYMFERAEKPLGVISVITGVAGIGAVFTMASVYATTIIPAWTHLNTYVGFFGTMVVFGAIGLGMIIRLYDPSSLDKEQYVLFMKKASLAAVAAVIIQLVMMPVYLTGLAGGGPAAQMSLQVLFDGNVWLMISRWLLTIVGGSLLIVSFYKARETISVKIPAFVYVAVAFILAGEFTGRYLFYLSGIPMNIG